MKVRAVIFDIYKTILEVGPAPVDAGERWNKLWMATFGKPARLSLNEFAVECEKIIAREHAAARSTGIAYPEIYWPVVTQEALSEMSQLATKICDDFLYQHAQLQRTVRLMPGAGEVLTKLSQSDMPLGIASNAQPYTLRELDDALSSANLNRTIFTADISAFSFANGFSKPNPHVFRLLTARLQSLEIQPGETLMVGDRLDNDIAPARAAGWQTWQLCGTAAADAGNWLQLKARIEMSDSASV